MFINKFYVVWQMVRDYIVEASGPLQLLKMLQIMYFTSIKESFIHHWSLVSTPKMHEFGMLFLKWLYHWQILVCVWKNLKYVAIEMFNSLVKQLEDKRW